MNLYRVRLLVDVDIWADDEADAEYNAKDSVASWDDWNPADKQDSIEVTKIDTES